MARVLLRNVDVTFTSRRVKQKPADATQASEDRVSGGLIERQGSTLNVRAIRNMSLLLKPGDRLGVVGRNGAGKTTLLRTIAGIYPPKRGLVAVDGHIATMFNIGLGMNMDASGYENIRLAGIVAGKTPREIEGMADDIIRFTGLGDYLDLPIRTYSQGMAMRLKFACATAFDADILLFDEWLGAGDAGFQTRAKERLDDMVKRSRIMVLATHNVKLMQAVCNQAILMHEGVIVHRGPVDEVIERSKALGAS
ncbi:lipopolysaccharide/O-antigen ABC transporter, ATP-binding protein [Oceanicaulis sp. HTCC2633]|jgi:lipopolysaccharide transport system ATP-binding protein|uniref:ABC transporter ATP-binding protein n=1 Tax=Oceanicaulis sp. HTCC2633 TaxID=314254 RepID=UPI000066A17C|nr:ATP-binding cassette domain-containing protein [Oceanicaulis sp. HTCC2633]EAP89874.1 lipopolysaccharide/O-antigen ABC transporter, ATP-binding protein [Oceanicaulis sp. HTCC2633]